MPRKEVVRNRKAAFGIFDYDMVPKIRRLLKPHGLAFKVKGNQRWGDQVEVTVEPLVSAEVFERNEKFEAAYKDYLNDARLHGDPIAYRKVVDALKKAAAPKHVAKNIGEGMNDQMKCKCGWLSPGYWDGADYAFHDWIKHVAECTGVVPRKCPCGKLYTPAEGGKPCHELRAL